MQTILVTRYQGRTESVMGPRTENPMGPLQVLGKLIGRKLLAINWDQSIYWVGNRLIRVEPIKLKLIAINWNML